MYVCSGRREVAVVVEREREIMRRFFMGDERGRKGKDVTLGDSEGNGWAPERASAFWRWSGTRELKGERERYCSGREVGREVFRMIIGVM